MTPVHDKEPPRAGAINRPGLDQPLDRPSGRI